jgi:hypothetical protein
MLLVRTALPDDSTVALTVSSFAHPQRVTAR